MECPSDKIIDHINHNTLDNRKCNLRICTHFENMQNRRDNKTGKTGVYYNKRDDVFVASIGTKFIGQSKSLEEAIKMREEAEKQKEEAQAEKEKEEEIQERIDAAKEKKKENEELTEDILEGVQEASTNASDISAAQQEIKDMMNKMKLIEDDIKGAAVDKSI